MFRSVESNRNSDKSNNSNNNNNSNQNKNSNDINSSNDNKNSNGNSVGYSKRGAKIELGLSACCWGWTYLVSRENFMDAAPL